MAEKGWLKRQLDEAEKGIQEWPDWKKAHVNDQYEELKQYITKQREEIEDHDT